MTPKRFRWPLRVTWLATAAAAVAATVPNWGGRYDANLAVLTLTLIAVVWYTYFSYRAAHAQPGTILVHRIEGHVSATGAELRPAVENRSQRIVTFRCLAQVWVDGHELVRPGFYTGLEPHTLLPFEKFQGVVRVTQEELNSYMVPGEGYYKSHAASLAVMISTWWTDDLGESGIGEPRYYTADPNRNEDVGLVVGTHDHRRLTADVTPFARSFTPDGAVSASPVDQSAAAFREGKSSVTDGRAG